MKFIKNIFCFIFLFSLLNGMFFLATDRVLAQDLWEMQEGKDNLNTAFGKPDDKDDDIRYVVMRVVEVFLTFLGIIFLILIILAGYKWMTSMGNQDQVSTAKSQLATAVIGFVIILISWIIVNFVNDFVQKEIYDKPWS